MSPLEAAIFEIGSAAPLRDEIRAEIETLREELRWMMRLSDGADADIRAMAEIRSTIGRLQRHMVPLMSSFPSGDVVNIFPEL